MLKDYSPYYNTNEVSGQLLIQYNSEALTQEAMVLEIFVKHKSLAWFQVQSFLPDMNSCSLKRAITNLKKKGKLVKTDELITGSAGKQVHKYRICEQ